MTNAHLTSLDDYRDIEALRYVQEARELGSASDDQLLAGLAAMSRDNARTPVQWDASPQAGFTTGEPWLPVNPNHRHVNAEAERADPSSVFHHYRRLIALRHEDATVRLGDFTMLLPDHPHVYAFTRALDGDALLVLGNFTGEEQTVDVDGLWDGAEVVLGNVAEPAVPRDGRVRLAPWEGVVLRRAAASG